MQEKNNYQEDYTEFNIKDLFWSVLRRWRALLAAAVICCVLLGGFTAFKELRIKLNDAEIEKRQTEYETALETYKLEKEQLEIDLKNLKAAQDRQQFYQDNALMLAIDQYNVSFVTASFCIETELEDTPETFVQNQNYTGGLLRRYKAAIDQIKLDDVIAGGDNPSLTAINPVESGRKLLDTSTDDLNSVLSLTIRADSEARAQQIYVAVKQAIANQQESMKNSAVTHSLTMISEQSYSGIDLEIGKVQTNFQNSVKSISESIKTTSDALAALKEPVNTAPTNVSILKRTVKYGVVGAVAGLLVVGFFLLVKLVLEDRMNSMDDAEKRYGLPVLGTFAAKKKGKLDAWIAKRLGLDCRGSAQEAAFAASGIRFHLNGAENLLLVGTCGTDKLNTIKDQLAPCLDGTKIAVGGNVNADAAALDALREKTAVVCVEEWTKTPHREIRHELQTIEDSGNRNLGFIVLG